MSRPFVHVDLQAISPEEGNITIAPGEAAPTEKLHSHNSAQQDSSYVFNVSNNFNVSNFNVSNSNLLNLRIQHLNVRSLRNKMAFVFQLTLRSEPDILCVSEHWMDSVSINNLCLDGFSVVSSFSRLGGRFGGSAVFVGDHLSAGPVDVSSFSVDFIFECSAVSLFKDELLLVCVYRTTSSDAFSFLDRLRQFDDFFSGGSNFKRIIYVGDFNIDVPIDSYLCRSFKALLTTLVLTIFDAGAPTRITESSRTCIDFF